MRVANEVVVTIAMRRLEDEPGVDIGRKAHANILLQQQAVATDRSVGRSAEPCQNLNR
jgi:hypothetical protein